MFAQPSHAKVAKSNLANRRRYLSPHSRALGLVLLSMGTLSTSSQAQERFRISGTDCGVGDMVLLAEAFMRSHPEGKINVLPAVGSSGG